MFAQSLCASFDINSLIATSIGDLLGSEFHLVYFTWKDVPLPTGRLGPLSLAAASRRIGESRNLRSKCRTWQMKDEKFVLEGSTFWAVTSLGPVGGDTELV